MKTIIIIIKLNINIFFTPFENNENKNNNDLLMSYSRNRHFVNSVQNNIEKYNNNYKFNK